MADTRIIDLPDLLTISEGCFVAVDSDSDNTRRYDLSQVAATTDANVIASAAERAAQVATEEAERRIDSAIDAMGDISEQAVPLMSADVRGGAKIQPNSGLEIAGTDNLQVRLALESDGDVRGGILGLTAKGHAEQRTTTGKNLLPTLSPSTNNGITLTVGDDGVLTLNGTASYTTAFQAQMNVAAGTYILSANNEVGIGSSGSDSPYMYIIKSDDGWANSLVMNSANSVSVATAQSNLVLYRIIIPSGVTLSNFKMRPQLELGSTATDYEPYTGGLPSPRPDWEQPIEVVRGHTIAGKTGRYVDMEVQGRNLWGGERMADDAVAAVNVATHCKKDYDNYGRYFTLLAGSPLSGKRLTSGPFKESTQYTFILKVAHDNTTPNTNLVVRYTDGTEAHVLAPYSYGSSPIAFAFVTAANKSLDSIASDFYSGETRFYYDQCGLFEGVLTVDDFEPYYHTTTPIPLPQRGWVGSLPDGTADVLTLDGAGKCEWEKACEEYTITGSETYDGSQIGNYYRIAAWTALISKPCKPEAEMSQNLSGLFTHAPFEINWAKQSNHAYCFVHSIVLIAEGSSKEDVLAQYTGAKLLYPLATPVTEDCGYCEDWPTDIPEGATVSIPELDAVGVKYFIDSAVTELARQWYARAHSEYEDRLEALEAAVAELVTGA